MAFKIPVGFSLVDEPTAYPKTDYDDLIKSSSKKHGVPYHIGYKLLETESNFKSDAVSPAGAQGIAQFMPATAKEQGVDPFDPKSAVPGAMKYLKQHYDEFGDWSKAVAAYNAGAGNVRKHGGIPPFKETQAHNKKIMSGYKPETKKLDIPEGFTKVQGNYPIPEGFKLVDPQASESGMGDVATGLKRGMEGLKASLYGAGALASDIVGFEAGEEFGMRGYKKHQAEAAKYPPKYKFKDVYTGEAGFGGAIDWVQGTFGELVPSMVNAAMGAVAGSLIAPGAGSVAGGVASKTILKKAIDKLVKKGIEKGISKKAAEELRTEVTKQALKKLGAKIGLGAAVLPMEAGGNYGELLAEYGVKAPGTSLMFGTLATSLEFMGGNSRLVDVFMDSVGKGKGSLIKRAAKNLLENVPAETLQEGGQGALSILNTVVNTDEEFLTTEHIEEIVESMAAGAVGGAGGAAVMTTFGGKEVAKDVTEEPYVLTEQDIAFLDLLNTDLESKETTPEQAEEIKQYPQFSHLADQIDKVVFDYNARQTPSDLSDAHKEVAKEAITEVIGTIDIEAEELGAYLRDYEKGIIPTPEEVQWEEEILRQRGDIVDDLSTPEGRQAVIDRTEFEEEKTNERSRVVDALNDIANKTGLTGFKRNAFIKERLDAFDKKVSEETEEAIVGLKKDTVDEKIVEEKVAIEPIKEEEHKISGAKRITIKTVPKSLEENPQTISDPLEVKRAELFIEKIISESKSLDEFSERFRQKFATLINDRQQLNKFVEDRISGKTTQSFSSWRGYDKTSGTAEKAEKKLPTKKIEPETTHEKITKAFPEHDIKYDGEFDRTALKKGPLYQFTPQSGELKGRTIAVEDLSVEAVGKKLDEMVKPPKKEPRLSTTDDFEVTGKGFEKTKSGKLIGYKVMAIDEDGNLRSGANSRLRFENKKGSEIRMSGDGVFLSNDPEYVKDYYSGLADNEVLLKLEFNEEDIVFGKTSLMDREPEIGVSKATVLSTDSFEPLYQTTGDFKSIKTIKDKWDKDTSTLFLSEDKNVVRIDSIIISKDKRKSGTGTKILNDIILYADSVGKRVELTPGTKDDFHGTTSRSRLIKFYKRFGFVENKGRNKDFAIGAGKMYREPVGKLSTIDTTDKSPLTGKEKIRALYKAKKRDKSASKLERIRRQEESKVLRRTLKDQGDTSTIRVIANEESEAYSNIGELFGIETVIYESTDPDINNITGFTYPGTKKIYANATGKNNPILSIIGHETLHQLSLNHPDLYKALKKEIKTKNYQDYYKKLTGIRKALGTGKLTEEQVFEEFVADFAGDQFQKPEFWQKLNEKNPSLVKKLVNVISDIINKIRFAISRAESFIVDIDKAQDALVVAMGEFAVRETTLPSGDVVLSTIPLADTWYSKMQDVLEKKLSSAPASTLITNLNIWARKGEYKKEELEWSGVIPWLEGKKGKVTKQEVLDYLEENRVVVEDVVKGDKEITHDMLGWVTREHYTSPASKFNFGSIEHLPSNGKYLYTTHGGSRKTYDTLDDAKNALLRVAKNVGFPSETKFGQYQLPGGKNYKEVLLTLQNKMPSKKRARVKEINKKVEAYTATKEEQIELNRILEDWFGKEFKGPHYKEPNILAHIRMSERTVDGKKVLHIEEIQSDWLQEGRKKGFKDDARLKPISDRLYEITFEKEKLSKDRLPSNKMREEGKWHKLSTEFDKLQKEYAQLSKAVPDAPFKKNWSMLAMKRMVRYAVENGFDTIAWTQGQEQADRYDLSKQVDEIVYWKEESGDTWGFIAVSKFDRGDIEKEFLTAQEVEENLGKEVAEKIVNDKGIDADDRFAEGTRLLENEDLQIGGEGMKAFYDRMLPNEVNKFFNKKAWGKARVGEIEIDAGTETRGYGLPSEADYLANRLNEDETILEFSKRMDITAKQVKLHALPITPKMKSKALREGMPLFVTTEDFIKKAESLIYKKTLERTNTVNQTAKQEGFKYQGSAEKGQAAIENIISTLRKTTKVDIAKEQKIIEGYRKLEALAKDPQASVASKQKILAQFLKILPVNVRSKVIAPLSFISRFKRIKTHEKRMDDALARAEKELVLYMRRGIIAGIKKGVTPKKLAKNRIKKDTIGHEAARDLLFIRGVLKEKNITSLMAKIESQIERKENRLEEVEESKIKIIEEEISNLQSHRNIIETFGNLNSQKLDDLLFAKEVLNSIILNGRALWRSQQDAFKETLDPMTTNVQQDISGQEEPKLETSAESTKRIAEKESIWGKGKGTWDAVENSILSWEFLMNKLSKLSGSKILQSFTTTEMGSVVQSATKQENIFNIETDDTIHSSAKRIFNAENDKALNKKFMAQEVKQAGKVFSYNKDGKKVDDFAISQMEAAYMYAIRKNPDSLPTFDKMGMTEKTFNEIENFIGPELKAWVDYNVDEYLQDYHFSVNQVYRQVYGTNLTKTPGYISWYRDVPGKIQDKGIAANPHETGAKGMSKGAFKERVKNTNPYRFMSFNDVLTRHVSEMNNFKAWAMPTKIINGVFNNRKTQRLIIQHHSANMRSAIKSFQTDFTKSPLEMRGEMAWLDKMRGNITTAMTALNPTIFLKQLTSIPAMAESIPAKEWIKYEIAFWANPLKAWNLLKGSKHWTSRRTKGMERDIRTAQAVSGSQAVANVRNLKNRAMFLVKWGDGAAILVGGYPVYKYHFDKNLAKMGREKAHQLALTEFETSMDRTQQASGIKDQGKFQRSGSYAKLFSMFLTAPKQYTSQITAAIRKIHSDPTDGDAYKRLFIFGIMMPSLFQATASGLLGLIGGDDEDEKKFISNQIKAILQSPLNGIPIIRDLQKGVWQSAMGEWYGTDVEYSPVTEAGQSLLNAVFHGAKLVASGEITPEKKAKHWEETINNLFETVGYAYGLPVETVRKMFMENWSDVVTGETDYPFRRAVGFSRYAMGEQASRYKRNIKHIKNLAKEIKENPEKAKELRKDKTYRMLSQAKRAESKIKVLRKRMNRAKTKEDKAKLKKKIENIKKFFNKKFIMKKKEK